MIEVTMLGCGGTQPLPERALAALWLQVGGSGLLLDCGEGTQAAARRWGCSLFKLDAILLTHYHGDHIFGLPGLLQTMGALGRQAPVVVAGPPGLRSLLALVTALTGPRPTVRAGLRYRPGWWKPSRCGTARPAAATPLRCRAPAGLTRRGPKRPASRCASGGGCKTANASAALRPTRCSARRGAG